MLRFPITPHKHTMEIQLTPYMVEKLATAVRVGVVTVTDKAISIAYESQHMTPVQLRELMGVDVNKAEHVTADTAGNLNHIPNEALGFAQTRHQKHVRLSVTGTHQRRNALHHDM